MIALIDANSFFASCEQVYRPDLRGKPVVVLSNNDGCVIARNAEAKLLGIPMGEPYFRCRDFLRARGVAVFSSNYGLYADISNRVMQTIATFAPALEVYSIDECFVLMLAVFPSWMRWDVSGDRLSGNGPVSLVVSVSGRARLWRNSPTMLPSSIPRPAG
jgi:DNA-directed DNA polymerase